MMWWFRKSFRLVETGFFSGFWDCHNHILPGVDDGVKGMGEALEALSYFEELGMAGVTFTPHVMKEVNGSDEAVREAFAQLQQAYGGALRLSLGAEYMLDSGFEAQLHAGLRGIGEGEVLVETSYLSAPNNLGELLFEVATARFTPVIAHPERYRYLEQGGCRRWKDRGYKLQLNVLSLSGHYGQRVREHAGFLLKEGLYDRVGTDLHDPIAFRARLEQLQVTSLQLAALQRIIGI